MAADDRDVLPTDVEPIHYNLSIYNLDKATFTYSGTVEIDTYVRKETTSISLNVKELELLEATIAFSQGKTESSFKSSSIDVDKKRERATLTFPSIPDGLNAKLTIHFTGILNNKMAGFYRSEYKAADTGETTHMFSTQFESCDARQAFPCFDEPNLKATFDFAVTIPSEWTALSNMPVLSSKPPADGTKKTKSPDDTGLKTVTFETSPKMSTYLLAWAVGDFEYVETETKREYNGSPIPVRVYTTKGLKEQGRFALENAAKVVDYFSEVFDIDYPLPKVDMLAVHEFSHGAMENWGLITYRTTAVLYDEGKSDPRYKNRVAYVVAHELAHQWFGNLVTMDWWNELWLNEGFATWVGWLAVDKFYPDWDVWGQFVAESMQTGFQLDSLRSSHPIEVPVRDALEVDQIFDHISYLKGSSVIRMLSSALGHEVFLKGVSNYLKKHKYANARTNDLWSAISEASGIDVNNTMDNWIKAIGFPVLDVKEGPDSLTIRQQRFLSTGDVKPEEDQTTWWVPLGLTPHSAPQSKDIASALTEKETSIAGINTDDYKLNYGQNGFYRVNYPVERFAKLGASIKNLSVSDRVGLVADAHALAVAGNGSTQSLLSLLDGMRDESNYLVWQTVQGALGAVRSVFAGASPEIKEGLRKFSLSLFGPAAEKIGWKFSDTDDFLTTQLRGLLIGGAATAKHEAIITEAKRQFDAYFAGDASAIHPALKLHVFRIAISEGGKDEYEKVWGEYLKATSPDGKEIALQALGKAKDEALILDYLEKMLGDKIPTQNTHYTSSSLSNNSDARPLLWKFVKERWDDIFKLLSGNMVLMDRFVRVSLNKFSDETILEEIKTFFEGKDQRGYDRAVRIVIDTVGGNVSWKNRDQKAVEDWLKSKGYIA